jgi:Ca2+-binding RTX toxin-like protein
MKGGGGLLTTNDVPGCPTGGLLSGTDGRDNLDGKKGEDEIHGLGGVDVIFGGDGSDVIYGGPGDDSPLWGLRGDDVIYGGDGNDGDLNGFGGEDVLFGGDGNDSLDGTWDGRQRDELYCGAGSDTYLGGKEDFVDSSCEEKMRRGPAIP